MTVTTSKTETNRDYLIEEVEHLLGTDSDAAIAKRLGYDQPLSLSKTLRRYGRPDLAVRFDRVGVRELSSLRSDTLSTLVARGKASHLSKTRTLATRLESVAADLLAQLESEDQGREAREKAERERQEVAAEVKRLTEELAAAKAKLRPPAKKSTPPARGGRTAEIRSWAREQGIPVGAAGQLRPDVIVRYDKATQA